MQKLFNKTVWKGLAYIFAFLLAFSITVACVLETFRTPVDMALGTVSEITVADENDENVFKAFTPPAELLNADGTGNGEKLVTAAIDLGRRTSAEGSVLLKNNGVLPLNSSTNGNKKPAVTLLGARSVTPIINSPMGQTSIGPYISLVTALGNSKTNFASEELVDKYAPTGSLGAMHEFNFADLKYEGNGVAAGANYELNTAVIDKYAELNSSAGMVNLAAVAKENYDPNEPAKAEIAGVLDSTKADFGDAAIVVIGRGSSENNDYLPGGVKEGLGYDEPLQLSKNERDAVALATENFDKVIVLLNTNSPMEIGDLKANDKVDAILWIGHPGNYGFLGVADILCGNVSPSAGLYDLYAADNLSAPAMMNMGDYTFANAGDITRVARGSAGKYIMEVESIYMGYRYYETRYYDSIVSPNSGAASSAGVYASSGNSWNYGEEVVYSFGYGMTYGDISYEFVGEPVIKKRGSHEIYGDFTVKVTNNGDYDTKASVQIYGQAPYTEYDKENGVEKAAIQLLNFGKTGLIAKNGGSQTVTVTVDLQNIASWDSSFENPDGTKGSWILEEGDYYFAVGNGAHEALNNIVELQGHKPDVAADEELAYEWTYSSNGNGEVDGNIFGISKNNTQVSNAIEYIDWNNFGGEKVTYLTRSDWDGTYPVEYSDMTAPADMMDDLNGKYYDIKTNETSDIEWGSTDTDIKFYEMLKADFNDSRWDDLLSQISLDEATAFASLGGMNLYELTGIDFLSGNYSENGGNGFRRNLSQSSVKDAPWAITDSEYERWGAQVFSSAPVVASTFNPDIMRELGEFVAIEGLYIGYPIVWGPGLNTHRHAYNGRNGEYYSEDPVLSGVCVMEYAVGSRDNGLVAAAKHYAFNDQETNRQGVSPFMTEQRAREIELRAYQIAIEAVKYNYYDADTDVVRGLTESGQKSTGLCGLMTSYSKVGPVEATCSRGMLTDILREEWGFTGYAVSDLNDDEDLFSSIVYAGLTGYDNRSANPDGQTRLTAMGVQSDSGSTPSGSYFAGDKLMQEQVKQSLKNTLWVVANSNMMNLYSATTHKVSVMVWWRQAYIAAITITAILTAGAAAMYVVSVIKGRKEKN